MSDAAIVSLVTGAVTILTLWLRLRYGVEKKLDDNTKITTDGTKAASENAKAAAKAAAEVKAMATETKGVLVEKLNGGIEAAVDKVMGELLARVEKLEKYMHDSFHKLGDGVQATLNNTAAIVEVAGIKRKPPPSPEGKQP